MLFTFPGIPSPLHQHLAVGCVTLGASTARAARGTRARALIAVLRSLLESNTNIEVTSRTHAAASLVKLLGFGQTGLEFTGGGTRDVAGAGHSDIEEGENG